MSDSLKTPREHLGCEACERWLHQLFAERAPQTLPVRLLSHVEVCVDCRSEHESLLELHSAVPQLSPLVFEEDSEDPVDDDPLFVNAVMAKVRELPAPVRRREWWARGRIAALFALAALVGVAVARWDSPGMDDLGRAVGNGEPLVTGSGSERASESGPARVLPDEQATVSDGWGEGVAMGVEGGNLFDPSVVQHQAPDVAPEELREWMPKDGHVVIHIPESKAEDEDPEDGWMF